MQVQNIQIFSSTTAADGAWIDVSNLVSMSVHLVGVEAAVWIEVSNDPNVTIDGANISAPASGPTLSQFAYGALTSQGTYFVKTTYITQWGETIASAESSLAVSDNNQLVVLAPPPVVGAIGWNVYIGRVTNTEVLQTTPAFAPQHVTDTGGYSYATNGALPLGQNFILRAFNNSGIVVPSSNTSGSVNVGINVLGTGGTFSMSTQTDGPISLFVDTNKAQVMWSPSSMNWKYLRVRKSAATQVLLTTAYICGQRG